MSLVSVEVVVLGAGERATFINILLVHPLNGHQPEHVDERQPRCPFGLTDALVPNDELGHAFQRRYSGMQISKRRYAHQTLFFWRDKLGRLYMPRRSAPLSVEAAGLGEKEEATPDSDSWWRLLKSVASMLSWYTCR